MSREGKKLAGVDPERLRQQLRRETDAKATKQLILALLYDAGFSPYKIEEILGFPAQTGYNWLDIVAERDATALGDASRPGRQPLLSPDQWTELGWRSSDVARLRVRPGVGSTDRPLGRRTAMVRSVVSQSDVHRTTLAPRTDWWPSS